MRCGFPHDAEVAEWMGLDTEAEAWILDLQPPPQLAS